MATLSLDTVTLENGAHASIDDGVCAMEMVAFLAGEPHSRIRQPVHRPSLRGVRPIVERCDSG